MGEGPDVGAEVSAVGVCGEGDVRMRVVDWQGGELVSGGPGILRLLEIEVEHVDAGHG